MDFNGDVACVDPELLQLSEVSPLAIKANPYVAERLYDQWLALPETNSLVNVVNPAMDKALLLLEKFAADAQNGKISKDRLRFGAPWRHPSKTDSHSWAKIQLMDFVKSLVRADFGVNYLADCSLEFLGDPSAVALIEVGLLYTQRDPSIIRLSPVVFRDAL